MARLLTLLFEVTALFDMTTRIELVMLQKTMVVVEGVARKLDPHLNMWATAEPVVGGWIAETSDRAAESRMRAAGFVTRRYSPMLRPLEKPRGSKRTPAAAEATKMIRPDPSIFSGVCDLRICPRFSIRINWRPWAIMLHVPLARSVYQSLGAGMEAPPAR